MRAAEETRRDQPAGRTRMRHPDGAVVDLYTPVDVGTMGATLMALGRIGFELLGADNASGQVMVLEPPATIAPVGGPADHHAWVTDRERGLVCERCARGWEGYDLAGEKACPGATREEAVS